MTLSLSSTTFFMLLYPGLSHCFQGFFSYSGSKLCLIQARFSFFHKKIYRTPRKVRKYFKVHVRIYRLMELTVAQTYGWFMTNFSSVYMTLCLQAGSQLKRTAILSCLFQDFRQLWTVWLCLSLIFGARKCRFRALLSAHSCLQFSFLLNFFLSHGWKFR